jgi:Polyketide cyclase / dehydrase and lipid transport
VQHEHTEHVAASPDAVYAAISNLTNLPRFVSQMIGVRPTGEDRVQVDARYEGHEQHGEASFHVNAADRRIEWAAPSGYRGWMKVDPDGAGSRLTLFLEPSTVPSANKTSRPRSAQSACWSSPRSDRLGRRRRQQQRRARAQTPPGNEPTDPS